MALERNRRQRGPLADEEIVRLFREIMSACLAQQEPLKVAFLGPEGTFTQQAVLKHFGHSVRALPLTSIEEVFREVESGTADFGVVPIENSSEGTVNNTLDMFLTSPLGICGEVELRIHQNLMGRMAALGRRRAHLRASAGARAVPRLAGREPARRRARAGLEQCRGCASCARRGRHGRHRRVRRGGAVRPQHAGAGDRGPPGQHDALPRDRLARPLQPSGADRTTLLVSAAHTDAPGALFRLLEPFARHRISMTRIESRPSRRRKWDYVFFIDLEGHAASEPLATALAEIKGQASLCRVLGSYPKAVL